MYISNNKKGLSVKMKISKGNIDLDFIKRWEALKIPPVTSSILYRRGICEDLQMFNFFHLTSGMLPSPFLFPDLPIAYKRIEDAINNKEKIILFGDRDVDGVTSIHILYRFLFEHGADITWQLPIESEPYGLTMEKAESFVGNYDLLITTDCGITNYNEINYLKAQGIDTIIIDHHQPLENIPEAFCIINPKYKYALPENDMAACVVSLYFVLGYLYYMSGKVDLVDRVIYDGKEWIFCNMTELEEAPKDEKVGHLITLQKLPGYRKELPEELKKLYIKEAYLQHIFEDIPEYIQTLNRFLPYSALGTISDIMPLNQHANRLIVSLGIKQMKTSPEPALQALFSYQKLDLQLLNSTDLAWKITPVLNSPGRMGDARIAEHFIDEDYTSVINDNLEKIIEMNNQRRIQADTGVEMFIDKLDENAALFAGHLNFFHSPQIGRGVLGITAAKLSQESGRPVIVGVTDDEYFSGSIRGDVSIHLVDFLSKASNLLEEFGGHKNAAGFRMKIENLAAFEDFLVKNAADCCVAVTDDTPDFKVDAQIPVAYLEPVLLYKQLAMLEPFGEENPVPQLYTNGLRILSFSFVGKNKEHLKITFAGKDNQPVSAVYWGKARWFAENCHVDKSFSVLYRLEINSFRGSVTVQMNIENMEEEV